MRCLKTVVCLAMAGVLIAGVYPLDEACALDEMHEDADSIIAKDGVPSETTESPERDQTDSNAPAHDVSDGYFGLSPDNDAHNVPNDASDGNIQVPAEEEGAGSSAEGTESSLDSGTAAATLGGPRPHADGWADENGERYYYVAGERVKGSLFVDGGWYRFDLSDGHMLTGWQDIDGKRYFYGDDGAMLFKNQFLGGSWYWFDMNEGFMWTGSANIYGRWYRYDLSDGHMLTGSQYIDGHWYRYEPVEGYMLFGSQYIDGHWYWYDLAAGMMLTGSQYIYGDWYWYDLTEGMMLFGWQDIYGGAYFYDRMDGKMYFGKKVIDGQNYRFHARQGYLVPYFRLYLDAGHGWNSSTNGVWDSGAIGAQYIEAVLTAALVEDVAQTAREKYGVEVVTHTDKSSVNYKNRQSQAVDDGCSTLVSIHFNAMGGGGYESYIHSYNSPYGSAAVQGIMHRHLGMGIGLRDRGLLRAELAVVGGRLPSTLLEVCFIDNASDMMQFVARRAQVVDNLAKGIYELSKNDECIGSGY